MHILLEILSSLKKHCYLNYGNNYLNVAIYLSVCRIYLRVCATTAHVVERIVNAIRG